VQIINFIRKTLIVDPYWASVIFQCHCDGADEATTFTDVSDSGKAIVANGNAQVDTAIKKYGTGALLLDGSGDYLSVASGVQIDTDDFTIECWAYLTSAAGTNLALMGTRDGGADDTGWLLNIGGTAKRMTVRTDNTEVMTSGTDMTINTWTHIAYTWDGTTNRLYQDGVLVASSTGFSPNFSSAATLFIGHDGRGTTNDWPGSIDDIRITKGVARYTSAFTPPTAAFPDQ